MIGLFLGDTDFSNIVLNKVKRKKKKYFIIDFSRNNKFKKDINSYKISIGKFGQIISLIKEKKSKQVLFAGKIAKPKFSKLRLDIKGIYYIPRIIKASKVGDAAILKEIINIFKEQSIKTVSSVTFNPELSLKKGIYSKIKPNKKDKKDIKKAITTLNRLGNYNYSQGTVVIDKKVIAIEGRDGTEKMLKKCKRKKNTSNGVLVKFPKKKQDLRVDLPTVGFKTLKNCKTAGLKGIVLKSKQNVFLDKCKCLNWANKNNMFILVK